MTTTKNDFTLYIGDLDPQVSEQDLNELFRGLSINAKQIRLVSSHNMQSKGKSAFVTFENREDAESARRDANDSVLYNRHIRVCYMNRSRITTANLLIKGLGDTTARDLEIYFSAHGTITSCKVMYDREGVSKGYGFLQYEKQEDAEAAIKNKNDTVLLGNLISVEHFVPRDQQEEVFPNNIFVRGFGPEVTSETLISRFSEFGEISSVVILPNKSVGGEDLNFGLVCYNSSESANAAIHAMHNREEEGIHWYVAPHLNRRERQIKLQGEFKQRQENWKQRNLYISKLQPAIDEEKLYKLFRDFGEISSVKVLKSENIKYDAEGNKYFEQLSRGSGFVCFQRPEDAEQAFTQMDRKKVEDREIRVFRWKPKAEMTKIMNTKRHRKLRDNPIVHHLHHPPQPRESVPQPEPVVLQTTFTMVEYNAANTETKKRLLGACLYPRILKLTNQHVADKITDILLKMKNKKLRGMLSNSPRLQEKVNEAIEVLREAWTNQPDQLALLGR
jgi:polyadenylate-binding protein